MTSGHITLGHKTVLVCAETQWWTLLQLSPKTRVTQPGLTPPLSHVSHVSHPSVAILDLRQHHCVAFSILVATNISRIETIESLSRGLCVFHCRQLDLMFNVVSCCCWTGFAVVVMLVWKKRWCWCDEEPWYELRESVCSGHRSGVEQCDQDQCWVHCGQGQEQQLSQLTTLSQWRCYSSLHH